jgi:hypothetical protein
MTELSAEVVFRQGLEEFSAPETVPSVILGPLSVQLHWDFDFQCQQIHRVCHRPVSSRLLAIRNFRLQHMDEIKLVFSKQNSR